MSNTKPIDGEGLQLRALISKPHAIARKILLNNLDIDTSNLKHLRDALDIVKQLKGIHNQALELVTRSVMDQGLFNGTVVAVSTWQAVANHPKAPTDIVESILTRDWSKPAGDDKESFEAYLNHPRNTEKNISAAICQRASVNHLFTVEAMRHPKTTASTAAQIINNRSWDHKSTEFETYPEGAIVPAGASISYYPGMTEASVTRSWEVTKDGSIEVREEYSGRFPNGESAFALLRERPVSEWDAIVNLLDKAIAVALKEIPAFSTSFPH